MSRRSASDGVQVRLLGVTSDAGANNVLPRGWTPAVFWNNMIQIQIAPFKDLSAVLASVPITLKDIVPGELNLFLRQSVEQTKKNHPRNPNLERYRMNAVARRFLRGEIAPLVKAESIE